MATVAVETVNPELLDSRVNDNNYNAEATPERLDVLVIGAGFTGCYMLHKLRQLGFKAKVVESGATVGGVWYWSRYPGARVDSPYPIYSLSLPEVWRSWNWTEKYPSWQELQCYFAHVDAQLNLSSDILFNSTVVSATFSEKRNNWFVTCDNGKSFIANHVVAGVGFAAKRYIPDWKDMDTCKAQLIHTSFWTDDIDVKGKKLVVIGSGSSGVQVAQECAKDVQEMTLFIRTPNTCMPMEQAVLSEKEQEKEKETYPDIYKHRLTTYGGLMYSPQEFPHTAHSAEEREAFFNKLWKMGGFAFSSHSYSDLMSNKEANRLAYDFWAKKTRARISDTTKADILAPIEPLHPFGAKRPSLEQNYYEELNRPNVHVVSVKQTPITRFCPEGVVTSDGKVHKADLIVLATGFDAVTGGLKNITISGLDGQLLSDKWKSGTYTNLGLATAGFPNFFFTYGPQSPTAFSNGPTCVETQCDWIAEVLVKMREAGLTRINATKEAENEWKAKVNRFSEGTLLHDTDSWYMGTNIPGKPKEPLNFVGGFPYYRKALSDSLEGAFAGFSTE